MKNKYILILLIIFPIFNYGQQLNIVETLEYISNLHTKYDKYSNKDAGVKVVKYEIDEEGFLSINFYLNGEKTATNSVHVNDINRRITYQNFSSETEIKIECSTQNCFIHKSTKEYYKNNFNIYFTQEYNAIKMVNALNYLFSLIDEIKFKRDENDPFTSNNINQTKSKITDKSQTKKINLIEQNGTYGILVSFEKINEIFILDTGASETTISNILEKKLLLNKSISKENYLVDGLYRIADGSIISQKRVMIKSITVGPHTVNNLIVSIGNAQSPLLLGRNFLDNFNNWTINNKEKTIEFSGF